MNKNALPFLGVQSLISLRFVNLDQSFKVIGVAMSDENTIDLPGFRVAGSPVTVREIAREELIVATINQKNFTFWCFNHRTIALLHIHKVYLQNLAVLLEHYDVRRFVSVLFRSDKSGHQLRLDTPVL